MQQHRVSSIMMKAVEALKTVFGIIGICPDRADRG